MGECVTFNQFTVGDDIYTNAFNKYFTVLKILSQEFPIMAAVLK